MWSYVFGLFGVHWVMSQMVADLLAGWRNWFGKRSSVVLHLALLYLMWMLWWD
jgi:hypothetical protein